jgi:Uma2 family endonuclease
MESNTAMPEPPARPRHKVTYEEYASWPDDGRRYEILDGEAVELSSPGRRHQETLGRLWRVIDDFFRKTSAGEAWFAPFDVVPEEHWVVQPDIVAVARENLRIVGEKAVLGVPDLLVEVLSPCTRARDRGIKREFYGRIGVRELWLVDVDERTLWQHAVREGALRETGVHRGGAAFESAAFPGLAVPLGEVWP